MKSEVTVVRTHGRSRFTVCLIGPDGVGKTTVTAKVKELLPMAVKYIYMGDNIESCNYILPTTRWWKKRQQRSGTGQKLTRAPSPADFKRRAAQSESPRSGGQRIMKLVKKAIGFVNRILDEWYRYFMVAYFKRRGFVVLMDRHFVYDYYHFDIAAQNGHRPLNRRLHGFLLKHTIPDPDLVICLDAPAEIIFKRKKEFSVEYIESRRQQYQSLKNVAKNFALVDANRSLNQVVKEVRELICNFNQKGAV